MATTIYALSHPETGEVRYVGKTVQSCKERLRTHLKGSAGGKFPVFCWIESLRAKGLAPEIKALIVVPDDVFDYYEIAVIKLYREVINPGRMLNVSDGGGGHLGLRHSEEQKAKWSQMRTGVRLSNEHKRNIGDGGRGQKRTEETRRKMSKAQAGRLVSDQTRQTQSEQRKGKKMADHLREANKMQLASLKDDPKRLENLRKAICRPLSEEHREKRHGDRS